MHKKTHSSPINIIPFGKTAKNDTAYLYKLTNNNRHTLTLTNYGANIVGLEATDKHRNLDDIVLGYDTLTEYCEDTLCLGAIVGRVAGRISNAKFTLNNQTYLLSKNHGDDHIHGGFKGFNHQLWQASINNSENSVCFNLISEDGDEGYPGQLHVQVTYTLTDKNQVIIHCSAKTNKATVVNLTQHAYFNLNGHQNDNILDHEIQVLADKYLVWGDNMLPTGEIANVSNTPLDLNQATSINTVIKQNHSILRQTGGIDHYWLFSNEEIDKELNEKPNDIIEKVRIYSPSSGRHLSVSTNQIGTVVYTGNGIPSKTKGKKGQYYNAHSGVCIEPQAPTNAVNTPEFPSIILNPEEFYQSTTVLEFTTD